VAGPYCLMGTLLPARLSTRLPARPQVSLFDFALYLFTFLLVIFLGVIKGMLIAGKADPSLGWRGVGSGPGAAEAFSQQQEGRSCLQRHSTLCQGLRQLMLMLFPMPRFPGTLCPPAAVAIAVVVHVYRTSNPPNAVLGRLPGTNSYRCVPPVL